MLNTKKQCLVGPRPLTQFSTGHLRSFKYSYPHPSWTAFRPLWGWSSEDRYNSGAEPIGQPIEVPRFPRYGIEEGGMHGSSN